MSKVIDFKAIGTYWWIEVFDKNASIDVLKNEIIKLADDFEQKYSRFLETSLITKLNNAGFLANPSDELLEMLELGGKAKDATEGHFDITVGGLLEKIGYDSKYSFSVGSNLKSQISNLSSENQISISNEKVEIEENVHIDLGGIGKGFLIDKVKDLLLVNNVKYFFINAGGDIYATSEFDNPIEFALENPFDINQMIGKIKIKNESIASSSPARRKWKDRNSDKEFHHLIDMKTNTPVSEIAGVFTLGQNATDADLASTAIFVSPKELHNKIASAFGVEYMVVFHDGSYTKSSNYIAELL